MCSSNRVSQRNTASEPETDGRHQGVSERLRERGGAGGRSRGKSSVTTTPSTHAGPRQKRPAAGPASHQHRWTAGRVGTSLCPPGRQKIMPLQERLPKVPGSNYYVIITTEKSRTTSVQKMSPLKNLKPNRRDFCKVKQQNGWSGILFPEKKRYRNSRSEQKRETIVGNP